MSGTIALTGFPFSLQPGATLELPILAEFVHILEASGELTVEFDRGQKLPAREGFKFSFGIDPSTGQTVTVRHIVLANPGAEAITGRVLYGAGNFTNDSVSLSGAVVAQNAGVSSVAFSTVTINAASFGKLLDTSSTRKAAIIRNTSANAVYLRTTTGNGATGLYLGGGDTAVLEWRTEIWAKNMGGSNTLLEITEESY
jgi:hypothetical protein